MKEQYKGLPRLLYAVRWSQHLLAIVAEILILLSFAMSGMDVSLGGVMAGIPALKVLWAAMFALGIDTAFALSWVRVRQCAINQRWGAFTANLLLALGMSYVVFAPVAIQLLQQSLNLDFNQSLARLGINIVILTYARSGVAVFLGAILAMTNVEGAMNEQPEQQTEQAVNTEANPLNITEEAESPPPALPAPNLPEPDTEQAPNSRQDIGKKWRIYEYLQSNTEATLGDIVSACSVSRGYASSTRSEWKKRR
jgi:hypothetical protein